MKVRKSITLAIEILTNSVAQRFTEEDQEKMYPGWCIALNDVTEEQVNNGLESMMKQLGQYMPSPGDFRKHCLKEGNIEQEALAAFNLVWNMNKVTASPYFKDTCIAETIRDLGGLFTISKWETPYKFKKEEEFIASYIINRKRDSKDFKPLISNGEMPIAFLGDFAREEKDKIKLDFKSEDEKLLLDYAQKELEKKSTVGQKTFSSEELREEGKLSKANIRLMTTKQRIREGLQKSIDDENKKKKINKPFHKFNSKGN